MGKKSDKQKKKKTHKQGLTHTILRMITMTEILICAIITIAGAAMIYIVTENSIRTEVTYAAQTLSDIYDMEYHGEYYMKNGSLYKGSYMLTYNDFKIKTDMIACSEDVDFTIFWDETRTFTTVKDRNNSLISGTRADPKVIENVLGMGLEYYYSRVKISDKLYAGYYIPIVNSSAQTVGMIFAGRPYDIAKKNMTTIILCFTLISGMVLAVALSVFRKFSSKLVYSLIDVRNFMENVAGGGFNGNLQLTTLSRSDEVGDIARSADTLRYNLRELVERDPLTTLLNRRSGRRAIDELIKKGTGYTASMADIDYFKKINDTYGHACGDMVLKEISALIRKQAEEKGGFVSRWGGEEFLMILPNCSIKEAEGFFEALLDEIRNHEFMWNDTRVPVTMTAGAVESRTDESPDETINRADRLLYDGKKTGRNRLVI